MANLNKNEKNSIKLILQAYATILEAFPRFYNLYQERLQSSYTLDVDAHTGSNGSGGPNGPNGPTGPAGPNSMNDPNGPTGPNRPSTADVNFCRDILHDDRIGIINGEASALSGLERKLKSHGIPYDKIDRTLLGDDFKAYSPQVFVIRIVDYNAVRAVMDEHLLELQKVIDEKELKDSELERERETVIKSEEEPEETVAPEESEEVIDDDDFKDYFDDEDDGKKKKKKKRNGDKRSDYESLESSYSTPDGSGSNGSDERQNNGSTQEELINLQIYERVTHGTSSYNQSDSTENRGFQTSQGLSLRDNNTVQTEKSWTSNQDQPDGRQTENASGERQRQTNGRSVFGREARETTGNNDSDSAYKNQDQYVGVWARREKTEENNSRGFKTSRGTSIRDNVSVNTGDARNTPHGSTPETDRTGRTNRRTVSGNKDDLSGRKNITQIIDFNDVKQLLGAVTGGTKNNSGGRKYGDDPLTRSEETARRKNPNITGTPTTSITKKGLHELFEGTGSNYQGNTRRPGNGGNNGGDGGNKGPGGPGNLNNPPGGKDKSPKFNNAFEYKVNNAFEYKVNTHTIDFTKEILQKRFENTIYSLNNMKSLHKVGHIVSKMTKDAMLQNLEGQEILRDAYAYTSPLAKFAVGKLIADGAAINNANTYLSQNVFRAMFEENARICGMNDAASIVQNKLMLNKLLHKDMTAKDIATLSGITTLSIRDYDALKRVHEKLLNGRKMNQLTIKHLMERFKLTEEDMKLWIDVTQGKVNFQSNDSLMKTLMGARNGGFATMARKFKPENWATVIGELNTSMDAKKLLFAMTKENMRDMAFLQDLMKKLKRMSNTQEAQDYVNMLMAIHRQNAQRMPKFSKLLGGYFALMMRKGGELVRDTDLGHGLNHIMKSKRGLSAAYDSLINLIRAYSRMSARLNPRLGVKAKSIAKKMEAAKPKALANKVAKKFGWDKAKAKFAEKATAKMAAYLSKLPGSAAVKSLVTKITSSAAYQSVAAASSSVSAAIGSAMAVVWEVILVVLIILLILSAINMISEEIDRRNDEAALMSSTSSSSSSSSSGTETKNGTLANGILADKDDLLTVVSNDLKLKNEDFMTTVNEALNNRGTLSYQVGSTATENVKHYEAERVVVRDAYGNELPPNQLDLNNTEAILSMASRYIPYDFTISEGASDEKKLENEQLRQYFIDYCDFLWAATHQITIEEYRPGNSNEQVKGTEDADDSSGMTTDAVTGACSEDGKTMWLPDTFIPDVVTENGSDGNEVSQQCSTCDEPLTTGTGEHNSGLCSHPKDDDLDTVVRIDGWRRTEEWRWAVNCVHGYNSNGYGDHDHKVYIGDDGEGNAEYEHYTETCKLSPSDYGHSKKYAYDSTGKGGEFHIHESEHIHKEYKWVYECGGHMGVVVYVTVGDLSRLATMPAAKDIDYELVGKYVEYDPEALKRHSGRGGSTIRFNGFKRGTNWGLTKVEKRKAWPSLTDEQIRRITCGMVTEQDTLEGVIFEASLLGNLAERNGCDPYTEVLKIPKTEGGFFAYETRKAVTENKAPGHDVSQEKIDAVSKVLREGERVTRVDEHDCFGDIIKIVTNGVAYTSSADIRNRDNYIPGETLVYNKYKSVYKFITFAVPPGVEGDPFGTTDLATKIVFDDDATSSGSSNDNVDLDSAIIEGDKEAIKAAIAYAQSKVGTVKYSRAYRSSGVYNDCSSFVYYCYEAAGINLGGSHTNPPVTSTECSLLESQGKLISTVYNADIMQPGDLIFWGNGPKDYYKNTRHVGIYIGGGQIVHCSESLNGVVVSRIEDFGNDKVVSVCRPT